MEILLFGYYNTFKIRIHHIFFSQQMTLKFSNNFSEIE